MILLPPHKQGGAYSTLVGSMLSSPALAAGAEARHVFLDCRPVNERDGCCGEATMFDPIVKDGA